MAFNTYQNIVLHNGELVTNSVFDAIMSNRVEVNTRTANGQREAFLKSSTVQTAVKKRMNAFANLNVWAKDKNGNKVNNKFVEQDLKEMQRWNSTQNFSEFNSAVEAQACVYGVCYVYKSKVLGLNMYDYYVVPFHLVTPVYKTHKNNLFEKEVDYFNVSVGDNLLELQKDEILVFRDNWINGSSDLFGFSRLFALSEAISTILSIGEMTTQLIADGGARGIIGQGAKDIDTFVSPFLNKERDEIQKQLKKYGGLREQFKYIVTKGQASYVPLTSKIVDMQLPELAMKAKVDIFDAFGIPAILAMHEPRFKAAPEARKEFYTATIIPEASARFRELTKAKGIPQREWSYQPDWSHMDFFQESLKESAVAIQQVINGLMPAYNAGLMDKDKFNAILEPYIE
jgi:phage portal protein BeeE